MRLVDFLTDFDTALEWEVDDLLLGEGSPEQPPSGRPAAASAPALERAWA